MSTKVTVSFSPIDDLLAGFTDIQLSEAIRANRAILQTRRMPTARKQLAREILTALHAEAGKRRTMGAAITYAMKSLALYQEGRAS